MIRIELSSGGSIYLMGSSEDYNVIITAHGIIMIFFTSVRATEAGSAQDVNLRYAPNCGL
jgi:heme/copper-type cytochrome/quinol oxidase subunit 1